MVRRGLTRRRAAAALALGAVFATGILASVALGTRLTSEPHAIVVNKSIGGVSIGESQAAVVAVECELPQPATAAIMSSGPIQRPC